MIWSAAKEIDLQQVWLADMSSSCGTYKGVKVCGLEVILKRLSEI